MSSLAIMVGKGGSEIARCTLSAEDRNHRMGALQTNPMRSRRTRFGHAALFEEPLDPT